MVWGKGRRKDREGDRGNGNDDKRERVGAQGPARTRRARRELDGVRKTGERKDWKKMCKEGERWQEEDNRRDGLSWFTGEYYSLCMGVFRFGHGLLWVYSPWL